MSPSKRTRAHGERREQALEIAARLINSEGVANATLSAVAENLGVRHSSLYYYFKDREDLHRTALHRTLELRGTSLDRAEATQGSTLVKVLKYLELELQANGHNRVDPAGGRGLRKAARNRFLAATERHIDRLAELIRTGTADGSIAPCHPYTRAFALEAILDRFISPDPIIGRNKAPQSLDQYVVEILRDGILRPSKAMPRPASDERPIDVILGLEMDDEDHDGRELQALLFNATRAFNEHGWNASIPAMASRLGKSKTVYYQIAADKRELLFQCLSRGTALIEASQRVSTNRSQHVAEAIVLHYQYLYRAHDSAVGPFPIYSETERLTPQQRRLITIRNHTVRFRSQRRLVAGMQTGWFRDLRPEVVQPLLGGILYRLGGRMVPNPDHLSFEQIAMENLQLVFEGLSGGRRSKS